MNGLKEQFGDHVDFIALNIDVPETRPVREQYELLQRSTYALIDARGTVLLRWFGFLDGDSVAQAIEEALSTQ